MIHNDLYKISQTLKKQQKTHIFKRTVVICSTKTGEGVSVLLLVLLALFFMKRMTSRYMEGTIICVFETFGVGDEEIEFEDGAKKRKENRVYHMHCSRVYHRCSRVYHQCSRVYHHCSRDVYHYQCSRVYIIISV